MGFLRFLRFFVKYDIQRFDEPEMSSFLRIKKKTIFGDFFGQIDRLTDGQNNRKIDRATDRQTDQQTDRQTSRWTDRPTYGHTDRQTDFVVYSVVTLPKMMLGRTSSYIMMLGFALSKMNVFQFLFGA